MQGRFLHNGLFIFLLCIYYDMCLAPCIFTVNELLLLLLIKTLSAWQGKLLIGTSPSSICIIPIYLGYVCYLLWIFNPIYVCTVLRVNHKPCMACYCHNCQLTGVVVKLHGVTHFLCCSTRRAIFIIVE